MEEPKKPPDSDFVETIDTVQEFEQAAMYALSIATEALASNFVKWHPPSERSVGLPFFCLKLQNQAPFKQGDVCTTISHK